MIEMGQMAVHHKNLSRERWAQMSLAEQMANIGSEISRAVHWRNRENQEYCHDAVERALELLALTIDAVTVKSNLKELTRLREAIIDYFYGDNEFASSDVLWQKYFDHFNYAARREQMKA